MGRRDGRKEEGREWVKESMKEEGEETRKDDGGEMMEGR